MVVIPPDPYSVEGTVIRDGAAAVGVTVTIRNLTKNTVGTRTTDANGQYLYDDIQDSTIQAVDGDSIQVSVPESDEVFIAGTPEERVVDFTWTSETGTVWAGLWKIIITPRVGAPTTFRSGGGVLGVPTLTLVSEGMGSFSIPLINDGGGYNSLFSMGDSIDIWLDAGTGVMGTTKRLTGFIKRVKYSRQGRNNTLILQGFSYPDKFKRTIVHELYVGSRTYEDIITNGTDGLLALYAPEVSGAGVQATGKSLGANETMKFDYITLFECLERIRNMIGDWIFDVTPEKVLTFQPRGYLHTDKEIEDFDDTEFEYDDDTLTNLQYIFGGKDLTAISKAGWSGSASLNNADAAKAYDASLSVAWDSGAAQDIGQWYKLDLGALTSIGKLIISSANFTTKYPRNYKIEVSKDNTNYINIKEVQGNAATTLLIDFTQDSYRYIKITLTGADAATWAISEIYLYSYYRLLSKVEDATSQGDYGVYERVLRDGSIATKPQSKAVAQGEITKYKNGTLSCSSPIQLSYFFDCSPNELVLINVPDTPINQKFAVDSVSFSEGTKGSFRESISLRAI